MVDHENNRLMNICIENFPAAADLKSSSDRFQYLIPILINLSHESNENLNNLKDALLFMIIDGIQYEPGAEMFHYPPKLDGYNIDIITINSTIHNKCESNDNTIESIGKTVHATIWKTAFINNLYEILEATFLNKRSAMTAVERPILPEISVTRKEEIVDFLKLDFEYFQNTYILLHLLTGNVPQYLEQFIQDGKADYVLQFVTNSLAELLANGNIDYWEHALELAGNGATESKLSADILYAAVDEFAYLTGIPFEENDFQNMDSIVKKFVDKEIKGAFV